MREFSEFFLGYGGGESVNDVVTGMDFEQHAGFRMDGIREIFQVRAVGGADFFQTAASSRHDVRNAE